MGSRSPLPALLLALLVTAPAAAAEQAQPPDLSLVAPAIVVVVGDAESMAAADTAVTPQRPTVVGRATRTARAFVSDLGYVVSSPFRLKGRGFLWTAGIVATTAVIYGYDGEILEAFQRSRGNEVYDAALDVGERFERIGFMGKTAPYWVGGALLGTALETIPGPDWLRSAAAPLQSVCLDVIESHLITGGIRNSFKTLVGRQRPFEAGRASFFKHGTSTPSGHTSVVFEVATILNRRTRNRPLALRIPVGVATYGIATCVAMQRVDSRGHWPSDVFLGAASGALIANTVSWRNHDRREREGEGDGGRTSVAPWLDESGTPRGILLTTGF